MFSTKTYVVPSQWDGSFEHPKYKTMVVIFMIFHTYVASAYFWGSKFWISIFLGVFRKMNIFWGYEDFVDIFLGTSQYWAEYFHTYVASVYFWGSKFWISIFWGVFRKMNIFGGYEDFVDIFWGVITKLGQFWGSFLFNSGSFLRSRYRIGIFFWGY